MRVNDLRKQQSIPLSSPLVVVLMVRTRMPGCGKPTTRHLTRCVQWLYDLVDRIFAAILSRSTHDRQVPLTRS